jgi:hypothetical protein
MCRIVCASCAALMLTCTASCRHYAGSRLHTCTFNHAQLVVISKIPDRLMEGMTQSVPGHPTSDDTPRSSARSLAPLPSQRQLPGHAPLQPQDQRSTPQLGDREHVQRWRQPPKDRVGSSGGRGGAGEGRVGGGESYHRCRSECLLPALHRTPPGLGATLSRGGCQELGPALRGHSKLMPLQRS